MDLSRLNWARVAVGAVASVLLVVSVLFLPWYSLGEAPARDASLPEQYNPDAFICGTGEFECTGFETFPILRWLLLLAAISPLILAWIIARGHKLSYPPGEMTMIAGFAAAILIAYNGIIDRPGTSIAEIDNSLEWGYWVALLSAITIAGVGFFRSLESGARPGRKAPGTV